MIIYGVVVILLAVAVIVYNKVGFLKTNQTELVDNESIEMVSDDLTADSQEMDGLTFVPYVNRSVGYTIDRPNRWYWRHYIKSQIGAGYPHVEDYFMTSSKPLPGLSADILGQIVIEVSGQELNELSSGLDIFTKSEAQVGGLPAIRYEGVKKDSAGQETKVIEYQIRRDNQSFRFIYWQILELADSSQVFEKMVKSFTFGI